MHLLWFAQSIGHLEGVQLFEAEEWSANEANLEIWSNASEDWLGFWAPKFSSAFFGDPILNDDLSFNIFLNKEAIAILAAIRWYSSLCPAPARLAICTFDIVRGIMPDVTIRHFTPPTSLLCP